jgi:hypothetical protein
MGDVSYFTVDKRAQERETEKKECISIMDDARYCCVNIKKKNDFFL